MTNCRPISVITATPPGFNPGMLASQVAARWFLDRHGLGSNATFFRLVPLTDRLAGMDAAARSACLRRCEDGIDYRLLEHADQLHGTTPLYWGDLLHMRQYLDSIRGLQRAARCTPEELLLLRGAPEDLIRRAVSFGTTFLYHDATDLTADEYGPSFRHFLVNARLVMPRDIVSLAQLATVVPGAPLLPGLDATQLFCGMADWRGAFPEGTDTACADANGLLCHFARGRHDIADLKHAVAEFSQGFSLPVRWLPWGDSLSFPYLRHYEGQLGLEDATGGREPSLSAILETVAAAKCLLTDTYHVAVIAWSLGTPALLIRGNYWPNDFNAVVDKRYVFYVQHGLQELFLATAREHDELAVFIRRAVKVVSEGRVLEWYRSSVVLRAEACERRLAATLSEESNGG
jgi:hypothetical protein